MTAVDKDNVKYNASKTTYSKPLISELSSSASTQGMGVTMLLMRAKTAIGTENDFLITPRSVS